MLCYMYCNECSNFCIDRMMTWVVFKTLHKYEKCSEKDGVISDSILIQKRNC
jgi:hypothetical protein